MRCGLAIDAFIRLVITAAVVGELIDVFHNAYGRPDIRRRVQAERCFSETPVTHSLIVG
ncbi:hypothetical protein D3C84_624560 [compost metagenome]